MSFVASTAYRVIYKQIVSVTQSPDQVIIEVKGLDALILFLVNLANSTPKKAWPGLLDVQGARKKSPGFLEQDFHNSQGYLVC